MLSISSLHNIPLSTHYYALLPLPDHTLLVPLTIIFATPRLFPPGPPPFSGFGRITLASLAFSFHTRPLLHCPIHST